MASRKVYYTEEDGNSELQIHRNHEGKLFVCISTAGFSDNGMWLTLPKEDAREIITELARDFDMLDESMEFGGLVIFNEFGA